MTSILLLCLLLFVVAFLYSSVGHGGASGYLAVMALLSISPTLMKSSALIMNVFVSLFSFYGFYKAGFFKFKLFWPLAIASIPATYYGAGYVLPDVIYKQILAVCILLSIVRMLFQFTAKKKTIDLPILLALLIGAAIGFLSGMLGIGGGIILSPILILFGWANLKVIAHANTGKGGAVRRGMQAARGQYLLFTDADNSTPIEELPRFLAAIQQKADVVIGSRAFAGANEKNKSLIRTLGSRGIRALTQFGLGLPIKDTQCGFKLFRRNAALRLCALQRMEGFSFDLEWLYLARKHGFRVMELPVRWFDAPGSKVQGLRDGLGFIRDIAKIIHNNMLGLYRLGGEQNAPRYHQHITTK